MWSKTINTCCLHSQEHKFILCDVKLGGDCDATPLQALPKAESRCGVPPQFRSDPSPQHGSLCRPLETRNSKQYIFAHLSMSIYHPMHYYLCSCVFPTSAQVSAESCPASVVVAARTRTHGAVASSTHGCHMPQESVRLNLANCLKIGSCYRIRCSR